MEILVVAIGAFVVGLLVAYPLFRSSIKNSYEIQFHERVQTSSADAADNALKRSRATLKGQIGERFAPFFAAFGFEPADARFLGSPVDYVVFKGMSDGHVKGIAFVEVKVGELPLTPFQRQVSEAIKEGRVEWRVVPLPESFSDVH